MHKLNKAATTTFVSAEGDTTIVSLPMETSTIGLLISKAIHNLCPDIKYVCARIRSILTEPNIEIHITHHDAMTLYKNAIKKRIETIENIMKSL